MQTVTKSFLPASAPSRLTAFRGRLPILLVVVAIAVALFFLATRMRQMAPAKPTAQNTAVASPVPLRTVTAQTVIAPMETQALSGVLESRHLVTISAEVAARLEARPIERGERIARGAPLAVLDDRTARAALSEAQAGLAQATAVRRQAEAEYARARTETASAINAAQAGVDQATAGEQKARTFTRTQELRQAEAMLAQAVTDENLAKIEHDRYVRLVNAGAVAQQTLDRATATYESAQSRTRSAQEAVSLAKEGARQEDIAQACAQVESARAMLASARTRPARLAALREQIASLKAQEARAAATVQNARVQVSKHRIASPLTGRVLETRMERGEMASPGAPVAVISDVRDLRAVFAVPEAARPRLKVGQTVKLSTDAVPSKTFPARITLLGYNGDSRTRTFRIEVAVPNPGEVLLPNMTARLSLPVGQATKQVTVPISAIGSDTVSGDSFVVVTGSGDTPARRTVTLGEPVGTDAVRIVAGLHGGERIAANPAQVGGIQ